MNQKQVVLELMQRSQSHLNGVAAIFAKAGLPLEEGAILSVQQLNALNQFHPEQFCELIDFLYPEQAGKANAGSAWAGIVGACLQGVGSIFTSLDSAAGDQQLQQLEYERQLAEEKAAQQKKTLYIVLGLIGGVAVIGIALFFMLSSRR